MIIVLSYERYKVISNPVVYQANINGMSNYQSRPDQTYHNFALGRSAVNNIIPKSSQQNIK